MQVILSAKWLTNLAQRVVEQFSLGSPVGPDVTGLLLCEIIPLDDNLWSQRWRRKRSLHCHCKHIIGSFMCSNLCSVRFVFLHYCSRSHFIAHNSLVNQGVLLAQWHDRGYVRAIWSIALVSSSFQRSTKAVNESLAVTEENFPHGLRKPSGFISPWGRPYNSAV